MATTSKDYPENSGKSSDFRKFKHVKRYAYSHAENTMFSFSFSIILLWRNISPLYFIL